ncbi:uncharacterized protein ACOB7L_015971 [Callospermophilus lateralis]
MHGHLNLFPVCQLTEAPAEVSLSTHRRLCPNKPHAFAASASCVFPGQGIGGSFIWRASQENSCNPVRIPARGTPDNHWEVYKSVRSTHPQMTTCFSPTRPQMELTSKRKLTSPTSLPNVFKPPHVRHPFSALKQQERVIAPSPHSNKVSKIRGGTKPKVDR